MEFKEKLEVLEQFNKFRSYKPLKCANGVSLSIQASYGHYCEPRETLTVEEYTAMEMAIFKDDEWSDIESVSSDTELIYQLHETYDGMGVYAFASVELIERLYQELKEEEK